MSRSDQTESQLNGFADMLTKSFESHLQHWAATDKALAEQAAQIDANIAATNEITAGLNKLLDSL